MVINSRQGSMKSGWDLVLPAYPKFTGNVGKGNRSSYDIYDSGKKVGNIYQHEYGRNWYIHGASDYAFTCRGNAVVACVKLAKGDDLVSVMNKYNGQLTYAAHRKMEKAKQPRIETLADCFKLVPTGEFVTKRSQYGVSKNQIYSVTFRGVEIGRIYEADHWHSEWAVEGYGCIEFLRKNDAYKALYMTAVAKGIIQPF